MTNAFEYGDALLPSPDEKVEDDPESPTHADTNRPYLNLATSVTKSMNACESVVDLHCQVPNGCSGRRDIGVIF